jgi:hypothetical protein
VIRQDPSGHGNVRAVKTGILPVQIALKEPKQKKESQQNGRQAEKSDLAVFKLQKVREHFTPFGRRNEGHQPLKN